MVSSTNQRQEIISLHVGNAGIQLGQACWELYNLEREATLREKLAGNDFDYGFDIFFSEKADSTFKPRAVLIDVDTGAFDEIRGANSAVRDLFDEENFISGTAGISGGSKTYACGYYSLELTESLELTLNSIRRQAEKCDSPQGFMIYNSVGGGTGSGFCSRLLECLSVDFGK